MRLVVLLLFLNRNNQKYERAMQMWRQWRVQGAGRTESEQRSLSGDGDDDDDDVVVEESSCSEVLDAVGTRTGGKARVVAVVKARSRTFSARNIKAKVSFACKHPAKMAARPEPMYIPHVHEASATLADTGDEGSLTGVESAGRSSAGPISARVSSTQATSHDDVSSSSGLTVRSSSMDLKI